MANMGIMKEPLLLNASLVFLPSITTRLYIESTTLHGTLYHDVRRVDVIHHPSYCVIYIISVILLLFVFYAEAQERDGSFAYSLCPYDNTSSQKRLYVFSYIRNWSIRNWGYRGQILVSIHYQPFQRRASFGVIFAYGFNEKR